MRSESIGVSLEVAAAMVDRGEDWDACRPLDAAWEGEGRRPYKSGWADPDACEGEEKMLCAGEAEESTCKDEAEASVCAA
jgi:hypothetical protein